MEITDNTKTLANALAEIEILRHKLDAAEQIIREAREQKPVAYQSGFEGNKSFNAWSACTKEHYEYVLANKQDWQHGYRVRAVYASPIPAMPVQNDKWTTITNEEWNIPKLGQRVIVCIDGVVQTVPVTLDCTDSDFGLGQHYWDHDDFEESPFVKAGDSWMPWPTKPQSEVKPSC